MINESKNIILKNIHQYFKDNKILENITYTFCKKKYLLVGPSGIGKTTLLNIISENIEPTEGTVIKNATIGIIFQDFKLLEDFTIEENIKISMTIAKQNNEYQHIIDLLKINHILNKHPNEISGGEQQRAAIARTLAIGADIIIADEPTGQLDDQNTMNIMNIFNLIHSELDIGFIVSSHDTRWSDFCNIKLTIDNKKLC